MGHTPAHDALAQGALEHLGEQGEDVDLHSYLAFTQNQSRGFFVGCN